MHRLCSVFFLSEEVFISVYACAHTCATTYLWMSGDNLWESVLPFRPSALVVSVCSGSAISPASHSVWDSKHPQRGEELAEYV